MDVVFEGTLSPSWAMQDVLQAILSLEGSNFGVLRICSPKTGLEGRLAVDQGHYIIGVKIADNNSVGYEAVKHLLSVEDGNFAFLHADISKSWDFDKSLNLPIEKLISHLPHLPEDAIALFDEKSLLDQVFRGNSATETSLAKDSDYTPEMIPQNMRPRVAWNMIQPLTDDPPILNSKTNTTNISNEQNDQEQHEGNITALRHLLFQEYKHNTSIRWDTLVSHKLFFWVIALLLVTFSLLVTLLSNPHIKRYYWLIILSSLNLVILRRT